ncbi:MAG: hypothetical protein K2X35_21095 [Bryobacteraceae bacterium]|nr:hypothetical protein [Bryobacteraceae bacterium]
MATETTVNRRGVAQETQVLDPAIEKLRAAHQLKLVEKNEEGESLLKLPPGRYGFSYAPQHGEAGLFSKSSYLAFEVHKRADGEVVILAYATPANAARLRDAREDFEIEVLPVPTSEATELVEVHQARLFRPKPLARDRQNALKSFLHPR